MSRDSLFNKGAGAQANPLNKCTHAALYSAVRGGKEPASMLFPLARSPCMYVCLVGTLLFTTLSVVRRPGLPLPCSRHTCSGGRQAVLVSAVRNAICCCTPIRSAEP